MLARLISAALLLSFLPTTLMAQDGPPAPESVTWEIHDENGSMGLQFEVALAFVDQYGFCYYLTAHWDEATESYVEDGYLIKPPGDGSLLAAYSFDSKLWYQWQWNSDHYDKVGGTTAIRSYYPVK